MDPASDEDDVDELQREFDRLAWPARWVEVFEARSDLLADADRAHQPRSASTAVRGVTIDANRGGCSINRRSPVTRVAPGAAWRSCQR